MSTWSSMKVFSQFRDAYLASPGLRAMKALRVEAAALPCVLAGIAMALLPGMLMLRPPPPEADSGVTGPLAPTSAAPGRCWKGTAPRPTLLGEWAKDEGVPPACEP